MSKVEQNDGYILPEYTVDNLGACFKIVLVNSVKCIQREGISETFIPDFQGLMKRVAITRAAHSMKLKGGDIKFLRKTLGLRSKDLADKLDISAEHLSRCEAGDKTLSANSEKVLRTLVLLEAVYVLQKAIEDSDHRDKDLQKKISKILDDLKHVVSGLKILPVHAVEDELVLHFSRTPKRIAELAANDHQEARLPEWLDAA